MDVPSHERARPAPPPVTAVSDDPVGFCAHGWKKSDLAPASTAGHASAADRPLGVVRRPRSERRPPSPAGRAAAGSRAARPRPGRRSRRCAATNWLVGVHRAVDDGQRARPGRATTPRSTVAQGGHDGLLEVGCGVSSRGTRCIAARRSGSSARVGHAGREVDAVARVAIQRATVATRARPTPRATRVPRRPSVWISPARASCDQAALTVVGEQTRRSRATRRIGGSRSPASQAPSPMPADRAAASPCAEWSSTASTSSCHIFVT